MSLVGPSGLDISPHTVESVEESDVSHRRAEGTLHVPLCFFTVLLTAPCIPAVCLTRKSSRVTERCSFKILAIQKRVGWN